MNPYSLLNKKFICQSCGREHHIPIKIVATEKEAISSLPRYLPHLVNGKDILILCDDVTYEIAGRECAQVLGAEYEVSSLILSPRGSKTVHAEEQYLPEISEQLRGKSAILTVGSGSITDLGKYVADQLQVPAVVFATAPSVNGYTSGVAALLLGGAKVALPVNPAAGVITDLDIASQAPLDLIQAGFADSLARPFANADWKMASLLTGEDFCPLPLQITTEAEKSYLDRGDEIIGREPEAISCLMDGLNLAGMSMVVAGTSAPASGGEHLISHCLDMAAHQQRREYFSWHGLQVGIGTMVSAHIYQQLNTLSPEEVENRLARHHGNYEEGSKSLSTGDFFIEQEFVSKIPALEKLPGLLPSLWDQLRDEVFPLAFPPEKLKKHLGKAKCPLHFREIGVDKDLARRAITSARYTRGRITILDIADELGMLQETADVILQAEN